MSGMTRIVSLDNPKVKEAVRLRTRSARKKAGRFLVEGRREVLRALDAGHRPDLLFVEEELAGAAGERAAARAAAAGARVHAVSAAVYAKIAVREGSDGLLGVFPVPVASPEALRLPAAPLVLAAVGIEKPGNVGALLRSADAFGVDAFVAEGGTDLWNPNVVRASLGCLFTVPVAPVSAGGLVPWARSAGLRLVVATPAGGRPPAEVDWTGPVVLLVGSEERGVDPAVVTAANTHVRVPMRGAADSLNVSVAAGILLYEADRQRTSRP